MRQSNWLSKMANAVWSHGLAIRTVVLGAVALLPFVLGLLSNLLQLYLFIGLGGLATILVAAFGVALFRTEQEPAQPRLKPTPQKRELKLASESQPPALVSVSRSRRITGGALVLLSAATVLGLFFARQIAPGAAPAATPAAVQPTSPALSSTPTPSPTTSVALTVPRASFEEPTPNAIVQQEVAAHGRVSGIRNDHQLILLLHYDNCYFPEHTQIAGDYWAGRIRAGADEAKGKTFTLNLADLGSKGVGALKSYEDAESKSHSARGICSQDELVGNFEATILAEVAIRRAP